MSSAAVSTLLPVISGLRVNQNDKGAGFGLADVAVLAQDDDRGTLDGFAARVHQIVWDPRGQDGFSAAPTAFRRGSV
jgi:hypothetical protein